MLSTQIVVLYIGSKKQTKCEGPLLYLLIINLFALSRVQNGKTSGSRPIVKRIDGVL